MPAICSTMSTNWLIETNSLLPRFIGSTKIAVEDHLFPFNTVVDVHEAPSLISVTPDLNFVLTRKLGRDDLTANRGGRFLASAIVGSVRAIDVVITSDAGLQAKILPKMPTHPLT